MDERRDPNDFYPKGYAPVKIKTALEFIGMDAYQVRTVYRDSYYMAMWCKEHGLCTHRFSVKDALVIASFGYVFDDVDLYDKTPQYLLNQSLFHRTTDDMEDIKDFLFIVLRSLRHLRPITGTQLYYASDERVQVDSEHYVVGDTISWPIFTSATTDMASLLPGLTAPNGTTRGTLFIIDNAIGYDIQPYLIPKKRNTSDSSDPNSDLERASKAPKIVLEPDISFIVRRAIPGELTIIALEVIDPKRKFLGKVISRYESHKSDKRPEKSIRVVAPPQQQQDDSKDGEISKDSDGKPSGPRCPMSPRLIQTQLRISHRRTLSDPSSPKSKMPAPLVLFSSNLSDSALSGNDSDSDSDDDDDEDEDEDDDDDDEDEDDEDDGESESYSHSSSEYSSDTSSSSSSDNVYVSVSESESESESSSGSYTASSSEASSSSDSGSDSNYTNSSSSYSSSASDTSSESEEDERDRNSSRRIKFKSKMSKKKNIKKGNPKHHDVSHKSKHKKHNSSAKNISKKKKAVKTSNRR